LQLTKSKQTFDIIIKKIDSADERRKIKVVEKMMKGNTKAADKETFFCLCCCGDVIQLKEKPFIII